MSPLIESLYAIIDAEVASHPLELTFEALNAGCSMVQLRAKRLPDDAFLEMARRVRSACAHAEVPFIINDRADIARLVRADGLHVGQDDLSIEEARLIVGGMPIGVSTHTLKQAMKADSGGADLIAFGPIFETKTKDDPSPVVGLAALERVCQTVSRPVVAIGGITPENAAQAIAAGARYVAAISALPRFVESAT
ncbi:MAG: thiamine phosphate synthase [Polyangiales bacterium]|jgi:thiamine-phosphate pyrophosphorylase